MIRNLDESFKNCPPDWVHLKDESIFPFAMQIPVNRDDDDFCEFNGLQSVLGLSGDEYEKHPIEIKEIEPDGMGNGWYGGFDNCIIDRVSFMSVAYETKSLEHEFDPAFYISTQTKGIESIELALPHMCHSRISNSNIKYNLIKINRPNGAREICHDKIRVGNSSHYINCNVEIRPAFKNETNQPACVMFFDSCYFENCTFDIHERSNVEFPNCVFM